MKRFLILCFTLCCISNINCQESLEFIESVSTRFPFGDIKFHLGINIYNPLSYSDELKKMAENGDDAAMDMLGDCYLYGYGIPVDYEKAIYWCTKAAMNGFMSSMTLLGECYEKGMGVDMDSVQAYRFYRKAAFNGDMNAYYRLASCYYNGIGTEQDLLRARAWFEKSAVYEPVAQFNTGFIYFEYEHNYEKAFYWFTKAANNDVPIACEYLGDCYNNGCGTDVDKAKAQTYYEKSYELGNKSVRTKLINYDNK